MALSLALLGSIGRGVQDVRCAGSAGAIVAGALPALAWQSVGEPMRPKYGTLDGERIALEGEAFKALPTEVKARVEVDFGYGPVRPYRQLLESLDEQL
jgi:hypothetical protein